MRMRMVHGLAVALAALGAINWGLVGLFRLNLVSRLLGRSQVAQNAVYSIVGLAGVWLGVSRILPRLLLAVGVRHEDSMESLGSRSLVGATIPSITGTTLSGRRVTIPRDIQGKVVFLAMGFSYDSRFNVEDWIRAFQERFGQERNAVSYEMAMIDEPYRVFGTAINEGMRLGTPAERYEQVITVYASQRPLRQALRAATTSDTWVYLLNPEGKVLFECGGVFDVERFQELGWQCDAALARLKAPAQVSIADWEAPVAEKEGRTTRS